MIIKAIAVLLVLGITFVWASVVRAAMALPKPFWQTPEGLADQRRRYDEARAFSAPFLSDGAK